MKPEVYAQIIHDAGVAYNGKTLFVNIMPETVTTGVLVIEPRSGAEIDHEMIGMRSADFQVVVRHPDYLKGRKLAESVQAALTKNRLEKDGHCFIYIRPKHEPIAFPPSDGDNFEFSLNFETRYGLIP